uniref:Uncharacterized protein n=1 Tax=Arundo donax TaxID=35708 RepID=A0A0A9AEC5_ARUDO
MSSLILLTVYQMKFCNLFEFSCWRLTMKYCSVRKKNHNRTFCL